MVVCLVPCSATIARRSDENWAWYLAVALGCPRGSRAAWPPVGDDADRLAAVARQRDSARAAVPYCQLAGSFRYPDNLVAGPD